MKYLAAALLSTALLTPIGLSIPLRTQAQTTPPQAVTLNESQQQKINQLRQEVREKVKRLFSNKQIETYTSLRQRGIAAPQALEMVNLSRTRREQLRRILTQSRDQFVKILSESNQQ